MRGTRDADAARCGNTLKPCRDIDAVAENVVIPIRNSIFRSSGTPSLRSAITVCIATAHSTASTTEGNSSKMPSPVVLTIRPPCFATTASAITRCSRRMRAAPASSRPISRERAYSSTYQSSGGSAVSSEAEPTSALVLQKSSIFGIERRREAGGLSAQARLGGCGLCAALLWLRTCFGEEPATGLEIRSSGGLNMLEDILP
jgi:hypothetical protein